jgi:putative phosphoesterase
MKGLPYPTAGGTQAVVFISSLGFVLLIGLMADIHGNLDALLPSLDAMKQAGVEELFIAGDLTGYYYDTDAVLQALRPWAFTAVKGNHERLFEDWIEGRGRDAYLQEYGSSLRCAENALDGGQVEWLAALPSLVTVERNRSRISMCHATPTSDEDYVYPDSPASALQAFDAESTDLWITGHTHYPVAWSHGRSLIVNPGSIGQQRCRRPGAHWATYDTESRAVVFHITSYDTARLEQECAVRDPGIPYLRDVLRR